MCITLLFSRDVVLVDHMRAFWSTDISRFSLLVSVIPRTLWLELVTCYSEGMLLWRKFYISLWFVYLWNGQNDLFSWQDTPISLFFYCCLSKTLLFGRIPLKTSAALYSRISWLFLHCNSLLSFRFGRLFHPILSNFKQILFPVSVNSCRRGVGVCRSRSSLSMYKNEL